MLERAAACSVSMRRLREGFHIVMCAVGVVADRVVYDVVVVVVLLSYVARAFDARCCILWRVSVMMCCC